MLQALHKDHHTMAAAKKSVRKPQDAVALLKADHAQVKKWFEEFEKTRSDKKKQSLATNICTALTVHTQIEEEIFYPAFLSATKDKDLHHEAVIEHDGAKKLIADIKGSTPADDYFDSKVHVLSEMIKHHVKEEEQPGGMFAEAKQSKKMDLLALGEELAARKIELMAL
jgi:hemerythrin superfamily protein